MTAEDRSSPRPAVRRRLISGFLAGATVLAVGAAPVGVAGGDQAPTGAPSPVPPKASEYTPPAPAVSAEDAVMGRLGAEDLVRFAVAAPTTIPAESAGVVAKNSPRATQLPGLRRPCAKARGFTVYATTELVGLPLTQVHSTCETPPGVEDGRLLRPGRANETVAEYGRCTTAKRAPCVRRLSVTSAPSCEIPHALYHALAGPGGRHVDPHQHLRLRGVPAIRFDGGTAITLYTRWTTLTVRSASARLTAKAARAVMPAPDAFRTDTASATKLPRPTAAVSSDRLTTVRCAE